MGRGTMGRMAAWVLAMVVGLPVLAYAGLVAINWNDEAPSAEAERLVAMYRDRPVVADADNGRVQMERLVTDAEAGYKAARSPGISALIEACNEPTACATALDSNPDAAKEWLDSEGWLLERYRRGISKPGWREEIPEDGAAPWLAFQPILDAQKLHLLDAHRLALEGDAAAVRDLLQSDLVFWRRVLASSDLLATKTVAAGAIGRNFQFGTLALRMLPAGLAEAAVPASWREPLTLPERSLVRTMAGEWHFTAKVLRGASTGASREEKELGDRLAGAMLQEQATLNRAAARVLRVGELSELPYDELGPALQGLAEEPPPPSFRLYNPVGTMLDSTVTPGQYARYIVRISDLEGTRRAALLAATLRAQGVDAAQAGTAVAEAPLRSPYDGTAFEWDAASGAVVFNGLGEGERGRHAVLL